MEASRRIQKIGAHLSSAVTSIGSSGNASAGARESPDDIVIVDAIRTPITRAKKVLHTSFNENEVQYLPVQLPGAVRISVGIRKSRSPHPAGVCRRG